MRGGVGAFTVCYRLSLSAGRAQGVALNAPRVRATLASPCACVCRRSLQCGAANPTLLPVVSDDLMLGRNCSYTIVISVSNYTNVRRCAFKGRRECAAVSIVEHRSPPAHLTVKRVPAVQLLLSPTWRAAVTFIVLVHVLHIYSVCAMRSGHI